MLYRKMSGNTDELSILGFGAMRLPVKEDGSIDEQKATDILYYAIDHGVNYVDTAWPYHMEESEIFLGNALSNGYRERVKIATKLPQWMVKKREDMDYFLDEQLKKLQTNSIDYYLIHSLVGSSWKTIRDLGVIDFLNKAKADGRIINVGFSYHGIADDFKEIVDGYAWDFCQIQYNFLDEYNQAGKKGLEYAFSQGLGIVIMEPMRGGNLAYPIPQDIINIWNQSKISRSPAEWALRWVWNHSEVTVVLSGMNTLEQVKENLHIANEGRAESLTHKELELIHKVGDKYKELMQINCTGCRYCMPCINGVDIPASFEMYNNLHMFGDGKGSLKMMYCAKLGGILRGTEISFASKCIQCGACLEHCPQSIEIPDMLAQVKEEFEGEGFEERMQMARQLFAKDKFNN